MNSPSYPRRRRRSVDGVGLAAAAAVLVAAIVAARSPVSGFESGAFRAFNGLTDGLYPLIWPFMQYGTFITIPALASLALVFRRWRLAAALAATGVAVYLIAKLAKDLVERGRPGALLEGVSMREVFQSGSLGFPSGHAAVAAAITVVAAAYVARRWAVMAAILTGIVAIGRMYVGAHLPLDLIGGVALGIVAGCASNLLLGVPGEASDPAGASSGEQAGAVPPPATFDVGGDAS
jgi:membrane-associated phospholipid phosphatase